MQEHTDWRYLAFLLNLLHKFVYSVGEKQSDHCNRATLEQTSIGQRPCWLATSYMYDGINVGRQSEITTTHFRNHGSP